MVADHIFHKVLAVLFRNYRVVGLSARRRRTIVRLRATKKPRLVLAKNSALKIRDCQEL